MCEYCRTFGELNDCLCSNSEPWEALRVSGLDTKLPSGDEENRRTSVIAEEVQSFT